ncbi:MAG TPA: putative quinol monooxygenase [Bacteroidales bacterium]|nr:putative quinol monooxygenase [Bacteroidales bacterium]
MKSRVLILSLLIAVAMFSCKQKTQVADPPKEVAAQPAGGQKMIIAKVAIKAENVDDFINAAQTIIKSSNEEEGCIEYNLFQSPYEKTSFVFVEKYTGQAAIDFHFGQPYFKEFGSTIANWTQSPADIKIYDIAGERSAQ